MNFLVRFFQRLFDRFFERLFDKFVDRFFDRFLWQIFERFFDRFFGQIWTERVICQKRLRTTESDSGYPQLQFRVSYEISFGTMTQLHVEVLSRTIKSTIEIDYLAIFKIFLLLQAIIITNNNM